MLRRPLARLFLSLILTGVIASLFFYYVPADPAQYLQQVSVRPVWLAPFLLAVVANLYLRSRTLAVLVDNDQPVPMVHWLAVSSAHNLSASVMGMVVGDALLFWLLARFHITWRRSLFVTLIARLLELPPLLFFLCVGLTGSPGLFPGQGVVTLMAWLALMASIIIALGADRLLTLVPKGLWFGHTDKVTAFRAAHRELMRRCMTPLLLLSGGKILASFLFFIFGMRLFGVELTLLEESLVFGIFNFAIALPLQGVMGLGTFEAYFSIGLLLLGWSSATAMVHGFLVHCLFLGTFAVVTALVLAWVRLRSRGRNGEA